MRIEWINETKMRTLYIIGNGFDLAHELDTRYSIFRDWLRGKKGEKYQMAREFVNNIEKYIKDVNLWSDFERALGSIRSTQYLKSIIDETKTEQPEDNYGTQAEVVYAKLEYIVKDQYQQLIQAFRSWARDIETDGAEEMFPELKDENNYFFSFNYTDTLESIYNIPKERIIHIHGNAQDEKSEIIVGHNSDYNADRYAIMALLDEELPADGGDSGYKLIEVLNETIKRVNYIIVRHSRYFHELGKIGIEKIVVLGHSYREVDWPYFKMISERCSDAKWELRWHSCNDFQQAMRMRDFMNLSKVQFMADSSKPSDICRYWQVVKPIMKCS